MPVVKADVIVLGAGVVGISAALHLQARGRDVVILDRGAVAGETSYGNTGIVQSGFPLYVSAPSAGNPQGGAQPRSAR
jgi:D-amino-acid dehydrogenase